VRGIKTGDIQRGIMAGKADRVAGVL
jgi:hypothetical protein